MIALRRVWHLRRVWQLAVATECSPLQRLRVVGAAVRLAGSDLTDRRAVRRLELGELGAVAVRDFSELLVLWEVFVAQVYNAPELPPHAELVVDLGCNVGASLLWFHRRYPTARIIGYEADPQTATIARRNVAGLPGIEVRAVAVAERDGEVSFWRVPGQSWASGTMRSGGAPISVPAVSVDTVITSADRPVDVMKIDIEGAEHAVLATATRLSRVGCLVGEYHDVPGRSWSTLRRSLGTFDAVTLRESSRCFVAVRDRGDAVSSQP